MAVLLFLSVLIYLAQPHCTIHGGAGASSVIVAKNQDTLYTVDPDKMDKLIEEKCVFPEWVKCDNSKPDFGPPDAPCICSKDRRFNPNSNTPFGIEYSVVSGETVDRPPPPPPPPPPPGPPDDECPDNIHAGDIDNFVYKLQALSDQGIYDLTGQKLLCALYRMRLEGDSNGGSGSTTNFANVRIADPQQKGAKAGVQRGGGGRGRGRGRRRRRRRRELLGQSAASTRFTGSLNKIASVMGKKDPGSVARARNMPSVGRSIGRIVGGVEVGTYSDPDNSATVGAASFMVSLWLSLPGGDTLPHVCGASVTHNPYFLLTAAHCCDRRAFFGPGGLDSRAMFVAHPSRNYINPRAFDDQGRELQTSRNVGWREDKMRSCTHGPADATCLPFAHEGIKVVKEIRHACFYDPPDGGGNVDGIDAGGYLQNDLCVLELERPIDASWLPYSGKAVNGVNVEGDCPSTFKIGTTYGDHCEDYNEGRNELKNNRSTPNQGSETEVPSGLNQPYIQSVEADPFATGAGPAEYGKFDVRYEDNYYGDDGRAGAFDLDSDDLGDGRADLPTCSSDASASQNWIVGCGACSIPYADDPVTGVFGDRSQRLCCCKPLSELGANEKQCERYTDFCDATSGDDDPTPPTEYEYEEEAQYEEYYDEDYVENYDAYDAESNSGVDRVQGNVESDKDQEDEMTMGLGVMLADAGTEKFLSRSSRNSARRGRVDQNTQAETSREATSSASDDNRSSRQRLVRAGRASLSGPPPPPPPAAPPEPILPPPRNRFGRGGTAGGGQPPQQNQQQLRTIQRQAQFPLRRRGITAPGEAAANPSIASRPVNRAGRGLLQQTTSSGQPHYAMGWGARNDAENQFFAPNLLETRLEALSPEECRNEYTTFGQSVGTPFDLGQLIKDNMICAAIRPEGQFDGCQGDSGGPLYDQATGIVTGVTSWGFGCGLRDAAGVWARTACFQDWLDTVLGGNENSESDTLRTQAKGTRTTRRAIKSADGNDCLLQKRVEVCDCV
mmetsp:Transcript_4869/g.12723  ORF Transcript_4869/g.12723 Transcript_4869/m.12723 type:complete len:1009 (-) Transcript_4869:115-3141(-)